MPPAMFGADDTWIDGSRHLDDTFGPPGFSGKTDRPFDPDPFTVRHTEARSRLRVDFNSRFRVDLPQMGDLTMLRVEAVPTP